MSSDRTDISEQSSKCLRKLVPKSTNSSKARLRKLSIKGQVINILDFVSHMLCHTTTELRCGSVKVAIVDTYVNGWAVFL